MTSIVHLPDFHAAPGPRNADRYKALDQIITEGVQLAHLGAWIWPGDLFDTKSVAEDRNALDARLRRMADVAPVVICYGNHDAHGDLDGFANLKAGHPIYVIDRPHVLTFRLATLEMASIFVMPYPHKGGLVAAQVSPGDVVATAADLLEPIFMQAGIELEAASARGDLTLMMGHFNVAGARVSSGQPNVGREIEVSAKHLDYLGPIYKGLNHIHKPQTIAGAHYAGSVCRLDYGETEEKRYLVIEMQHDGPTQEHRIGSRPIDIAPMYHVEGLLTRDGFDYHVVGSEAPLNGAAIDWTGCDVRVRYSYNASEKAVLSEQFVRDQFAGALRLKIEGIVVADREIRSPAVAAAKTLPEKVAAYRKVDALEPSIADKLAALEQQDPERLLADVSAAIAAIERPQEVTVAA